MLAKKHLMSVDEGSEDGVNYKAYDILNSL